MAIPAIKPYEMPKASDLQKNKVSWKVDPNRSVLLIHDMQQYFLNAYTSGESPVVELIDNIKRIKEQCRELGIPVLYSAQPGNQKPEDRALLQDFWGSGLIDDPAETRIIRDIEPSENDTVLTKWRYSAFKRTNLKEFMQEEGRDQLIICGIYAHIGCLLTACEAFMEDIQTFFVYDAVADFSLDEHKMAIKYAAERCASTISASMLIKDLKDGKPSSKKEALTLQSIREQVAEILGEVESDIDDDENLIDRGLDSIRIMSLAEKWRSIKDDVNFVKLAKEPTVSAWWNLLSSSK
ncbi:isochorismatase [Clostridium sp. SHJSY1]|uniref:isochorismatase n=1 Tax=Clostridium sp. SHJSY1 TaxID=2942483 RepID=UPI002875DD7B|nr:isochorismatase [Clostridium sp. SHJSY1]MDS0527390.1 isochorismatase [Clostridium sp. SHJSY1]